MRQDLCIMIKPASGKCNMNCKYCFYKDEMKCREISDYGIMNTKVSQEIIKKTLAQSNRSYTVIFQGGEPTLAGLDYYETIIKLVEKYNINNCKINYSIQTNGYNIDHHWARFLKKYNFLVGISLDGYREIHDTYRVNVNKEYTFSQVMQSIELLKMYNVDFNVVTVVTNEVADNIGEIYSFYKSNKFIFQQYIPCIDSFDDSEDKYLDTKSYTEFLIKLFDLWYDDMSKKQYVYIRYFDNLLALMSGINPEQCDVKGQCSNQLVFESDGSVYPCDFYVLDEYKIGNILDNTLDEIEMNIKQTNFIDSSKVIPNKCVACNVYKLCRNGCNRSRIVGECKDSRLNKFCDSYKEFLEYAVLKLEHILMIWFGKENTYKIQKK